MLICVDRTGKHDTAEYFTKVQNSFVLQIYGKSVVSGKRYHRGPGVTGLGRWAGGMQIPPAALVAEILQMWNLGDHQIFLTGFSRGGATVINTAALLQQQRKDIEIQAMFLFDAVDRSVELTMTSTIPANVRKCYHALRADDTGSRGSFGHCGLKIQGDPSRLIKRDFITTHGGVGGCCFGEREGLRKRYEFIDPIPGLERSTDPKDRPDARAVRADLLRNAHIDEGFLDFDTRLTVTQEAMGCREVADWMSQWLRLEQVCTQTLTAVTVSARDKNHPQGIPRIIPAARQA